MINSNLSILINEAKSKIFKNEFHALEIIKGYDVIVYGHGEGYLPLHNSVLSRFNIIPKYIIDKKYNEEAQDIDGGNGKLLIGSNKAINIKNKNNFCIIVSIGNINSFNDVSKNLLNLGFKKIVWAPNIFEFNIHHHDHDYDTNPYLIFLDANEISQAYQLLEDSISQATFLSLLKTYITHEPQKIESKPISEQYFDLTIFKKTDYRNYINCGAYTGDSILSLINNIGKINNLIAIEPDPVNFNLLKDLCNQNKSKIANNISLLPFALGDENKTEEFTIGSGLCSEMGNKGSSVGIIEVKKLDDIISKDDFTFISIDIEGYEMKAIKGAENIIKKSPNLAISIYHRVFDLWKIVNLINSINSNYKFYIRNYTGFSYETVLYCKKNDA